ncbi:F-box/kelch-repeat protein SKIP11 [Raphanus sativus]|uniref:F-box/kelch-repeat protein SKIP11-like n=1 Tax=Raphanus sativus TaxID=3726 RepID=A0A6J0JS71_RAPSA|nr:F-box/kelch-repeat protein SKIP11-like [Raphanus sativus]KAJ4888314.1 F-box/kelch-repeat protein SKIP11 [Raphanus sativus]
MSDNNMTSLMRLPNDSPLPDVIALCWRSDIISLSKTNRRLRAIVREAMITMRRKQLGLLEHWFFIFVNLSEWCAYDPYNRAWHNVPLMPELPCNWILSDRQIMCVGSELLTCAESPVDTMYKFQALTGRWSLVAGMTTQPAYGHAWAVHEDKIFAAGGYDADKKSLPSAHIYDSETGLWSQIPPMTHARICCKGAFINGKFYVVGGKLSYYDTLQTTIAEVYDPNSKTWSMIQDFLTEEMATNSYAITVVNKEMYHANPSSCGKVHKYIPSNGEWIYIRRFPWEPLLKSEAYHMAAYRPVRDQPFEHLVLMLWRQEKSEHKMYVEK